MVFFLWRDVLGVNPIQVARTHSPPVAAVSIDADTLLVPSNNSALDDVAPIRLEPYTLADFELHHCNLCAELADHLDSLNDLPVQCNQFLFR